MDELFCKKSVFCILYLIFFFLGTICGVLLVRSFSAAEGPWLVSYCGALSACSAGMWRLLAWVRPLVLAWLAGLSGFGCRLIPWLIALRGALMAYEAAACCVCGQSPRGVLLRGLVILPLFFSLCRQGWIRGF